MPKLKHTKLTVIEANIDDMNPEWYEPLMQSLLEAGALDVTLQPILMKKTRPAVLLNVLTSKSLREKMMGLIFQESTTIGLRYYEVDRVELNREIRTVKTSYGPVRVKIGKDADGSVMNVAPEHESCRELARKKKIPLKTIYQAALSQARAALISQR